MYVQVPHDGKVCRWHALAGMGKGEGHFPLEMLSSVLCIRPKFTSEIKLK